MKKKNIFKVLSVMLAVSITATQLPLSVIADDGNVIIQDQTVSDNSLENDDEVILVDEEVNEAESVEEVLDIENVTGNSDAQVTFYRYEKGETSEYGYADYKLVNDDGQILTQKPYVPERNVYNEEPLEPIYDLREEGYISTVVENQVLTGTCWAHGSLAAAESNMIKKGLAKNDINLSEAHLMWFSIGSETADKNDPLYGDSLNVGKRAFNYGGNNIFVVGALSRGSGVQFESKMPDISALDETVIDTSILDPEDLTSPDPSQYPDYSEYENQRYVSEGLLVRSTNYNPKTEATAIKKQLKETGAMTLSYFADKNFEIQNGERYYCPIQTSSNHEICIVGWDDTIPAEDFKVVYRGTSYTPSKDGAWICKNSWGSSYGDNGYFYISYCDKSLRESSSFEIVPRNEYGKIYQYSAVQAGVLQSSVGNSLAIANKYVSETSDPIVAVGIENEMNNASFYVDIIVGGTDTDIMKGTSVYHQKVNMAHTGYEVIDLDYPVSIGKGMEYAIVLRYLGSESVVPVDRYNNNGKSFMAFCDSQGKVTSEWSNTKEAGYEFCLKVFTENSANPAAKAKIKASVDPGTYFEQQFVELTTDVANAEIHYSLESLRPTKEDTLYTEKIPLKIGSKGTAQETVLVARLVIDGVEQGPCAIFVYNVINRDTLISIEKPENLILYESNIPLDAEKLKLPKTVKVKTESDSITEAPVEWDLVNFASGSYNPAISDDQTFELNGKVILPDTIDVKEVSLNVKIKVIVAGNSYIVTFDPLNGTLVGEEMLIIKKNKLVSGLPLVEVPGKDFLRWTVNGVPLVENALYPITENAVATPVFTDVTLVPGQKYDITSYFAGIIEKDPTAEYRVKVTKPKAKVTKEGNSFIVTAKSKGKTYAYLQKKEGKKWVRQTIVDVPIKVITPKKKNISGKLSKTSVYDAKRYITNVPEVFKCKKEWSIYNKAAEVATIDPATGMINIVGKGKAVVTLKLTRDKVVKEYKIKLTIK